MLNKQIISYQEIRKLIPKYDNLDKFKNMITQVKLLKRNHFIGLIREWRAFYYLKKNHKFGDYIKMSNFKNDVKGIDLISYDKNNCIKFTFQVSGFTNQKVQADYIIKVGQQIYIYKNKGQNMNEENKNTKQDYFKIPMFRERLKIILNNYNADLQIIKSIEEMSELNKELSKHLIESIGSLDQPLIMPNPFILDEIADVYIMLGQLKMIFRIDENTIGRKIDEKLSIAIEKIGK